MRFFSSFSLLLTLSLGLSAVKPAEAAVLYEFSLPANGDIGPVQVQFTFANFSATPNLVIVPANTSSLTFLADPLVSAGNSVLGLMIESTTTYFGIDLKTSSNQSVLYTPAYPTDFFTFTRGVAETGTFTATGYVTSHFGLDIAFPTATLTVSEISDVPEPATLSLVGICLVGAAAWRKRKHTTQTQQSR
ncbi:PEP-CTERM sorting domain-containing protein [Bryobacter aggregatus]|uniref:PEP-CTERM sorting domain-containing protein n=1 Tax=Bryobacter aggregatus TaxID=360054 RepID=UPI0004E14D72|nr:PEP-CTERM sorting domain-containing protein [Bryobacter aggregatus]